MSKGLSLTLAGIFFLCAFGVPKAQQPGFQCSESTDAHDHATLLEYAVLAEVAYQGTGEHSVNLNKHCPRRTPTPARIARINVRNVPITLVDSAIGRLHAQEPAIEYFRGDITHRKRLDFPVAAAYITWQSPRRCSALLLSSRRFSTKQLLRKRGFSLRVDGYGVIPKANSSSRRLGVTYIPPRAPLKPQFQEASNCPCWRASLTFCSPTCSSPFAPWAPRQARTPAVHQSPAPAVSL